MSVSQPIRSLSQCIEDRFLKLHVATGFVAFPYHWQVPAATEKAAFESIRAVGGVGDGIVYVGYPWATLIDALRRRSALLPELMAGLYDLNAALKNLVGRSRCVTVAQHIHAREFVGLLRTVGITDMFWSHAVVNERQVGGVAIHPFPLYPAQAPGINNEENRSAQKQYLANFIGAYNPGIYLSNVRQVIFDDLGKDPDLLIIKREAWHFDRAVYIEQLHGVSVTKEQSQRELSATQEYIDAIRNSWFTLCPSGSGPNSIRIYEALALGSIPIVLTRALRLTGIQVLWEQAALIEEDSEAGYRRAILKAKAMSVADRERMVEAGSELFACVGPEGYADLVLDEITGK